MSSSQLKAQGLKWHSMELFSLDDLSDIQRTHIQSIVAEVCAAGGLLGVSLTARGWDMRPVVRVAGEPGASIIRFVGPDLGDNEIISSRLSDIFERRAQYKDLSLPVLDWGVLNNQLWYRREIYDETLESLFEKNSTMTLKEAVRIAESLVSKLAMWHDHGIVHGHLTTSNIHVKDDGSVVLLDPGIAASLVQNMPDGEFPQGYSKDSFAPEVFSSQTLLFRVDLYNLGLVLKELFDKASISGVSPAEEDFMLRKIRGIVEPLSEVEPKKRPTLLVTKMALEELSNRIKKNDGEDEQGQGDTLTQGKVIGITAHIPLGKMDNSFASAQSAGTDIPEEKVAQPNESAVASSSAVAVPTSAAKNFGSFWIACSAAVLCFALYSAFWAQSPAPVAPAPISTDFASAWDSNIPSRVKPVGLAAIKSFNPDKFAEEIIINSALKRRNIPTGFNDSLVRIAFNPVWEVELSKEDRRAAIALSMARILREDTPRDLAKLSELHAGVLFGITATAGSDIKAALESVPAQRLTQLPLPFGRAFSEIVSGREGVSCGDDDVVALARIIGNGIGDGENFTAYLRRNAARRIMALAAFASSNDKLSSSILTLILKQSPKEVDLASLSWAQNWKLAEWTELDALAKLRLIAGEEPATTLTPVNLVKLIAHPNGKLRAFALEKAQFRIRMSHPGSEDVIKQLRGSPDSLSPTQTMQLIHLLEDPYVVKESYVKKWIASEPPLSLLEFLLVSSRKASKPSKFDVWLLGALKSKNWNPDVSTLRKLRLHPSSVVRLYSYSEIFKRAEKGIALQLLTQSSQVETDRNLSKKLKDMLAILRIQIAE